MGGILCSFLCKRYFSPSPLIPTLVASLGVNTLDPNLSTGEYDSSPPNIRTSEKHHIVISSCDEDDTSGNITRSSNPRKRPMWRTIQRKWTSSPHDRYDTFTVMTYNLLSNRLALKNKHLYNRCAKNDIKWENRSQLLMQELRSQMLDIYCLQEIDKEHYVSLFQPTFREWGYNGVFKKRNGDKPDGCAIFFRNKTVRAVKLLGVDFDENAFTKKENIGIVGIFDIKLTAFHRAFPDNGHGFSPTSKPAPATSPAKTSPDSTVTTATPTRTIATETATTIQIQPSALTWSASSLRSLIRKSKREWDEKTDSTTKPSTATLVSSPTNANSTDTKAANTHIIFNNDGSSKTTTTTTSTTHNSRPGSLICQPFALKSAYPFFPQEEAARNLGSNRSAKGGPWTTFHSGGQLVCDYIFHGHLRVPVTPTGANPSISHSNSTSTTAVPEKLQVDGILELPCADLHQKGIRSLPCSELGSDHLSLVARFKFVGSGTLPPFRVEQ
ncbi:MAG: hypothetical protein JOS17DRAFT_484924 [Linnemannia elongata]|nr:MAG: hypothetical protein JOS17DRAFT_484924 [Linnemannia elongata]